jgi:hypothetical protein
MSEDNNFNKFEATKFVARAWEQVFYTSNQVLTHSKLYGFFQIQLLENPNIKQLLESMTMVSGILDKMLANLDAPDVELSTDDVRLLLNAKKQVTQLELVAAALNSGNEELYNEEVEKLKGQAAF